MKQFANSNLRFFSDLISTSAVKNHRLSLLLLMLFTLLLLPANMVAQKAETAYAVLDAPGTLTFKYGVKPAEGAFELNQDEETPNWKEFQNVITKVVFEESFKQASPTTCYAWFQNCSNLEKIEYLQYLNTSKVTDMAYMFNGCSKLASLDLSNFNTEKVQHMRYMFAGCNLLASLNLSKFNTADVRNMNSMFKECYKLNSLDLSNFNTAKVKDMNNMFFNCQNLTSLNLSNFNTEKVQQMYNMFAYCKNLTSLDLSSFDTRSVENMKCMFDYCQNLTSLDISKFDTRRVKSMELMFAYCQNLETIYSEDFMTGRLKSSYNMFNQCNALKGAINYQDNTQIKDANGASWRHGYFTKLVGKNGSEKIGATGKPLTVARLDLTDDKDFVANDEPFTVKVASYSRTMKEGTTWGTLCLPFEVSLEGQNFRAFTLRSVTEDAIELEEITSYINAGYPVIIKMNDGKTNLNFTVENNDIAITPQDTDEKYQLQGLYTQKEFSKDADNNCYIVKGNKLMNPGKLLENKKVTKVVSKPFRAYMVDNSSAPDTGAKMFSIGISDSATAIDTLNTIANDKAEYFDLQGHRLNEPQKGINIVKRNGKTMKVIIK